MVSPGSNAAGDGSFGRSTGIQVGRAALLIGAAVVIGLLLLHRSGGAVVVNQGSGNNNVSLPTFGSSTTTGTGSGTGAGTGTTAPRTSTPPSTVQVHDPQAIKVLVANGTTTPGLAGKVSNLVHAKGYVTLASTNSTQKPSQSIVYFEPSYGDDAAALAAKLGLQPSAVQAIPQPPPVASLNSANLLLIVGPDLASAASTTSTT